LKFDEGLPCAANRSFDYRRQHGLRIKVARLFNTYGPRLHPNDGRVVSTMNASFTPNCTRMRWPP